MKNKFEFLNNITYLYLMIPIIIFLIGWVKLYISIPISIFILFSIINRFKNKKINILKYLKENKKEVIITLLISIILIYLSGIGGFVYQNKDQLYRNSIFSELIHNKWPIYLNPGGEFTKDVMMVYYFALWLPAAVIGKIFTLKIGEIFFFIWCVIGLYLFLSYLKKYSSKDKYLIPIFLFIGFSGLDIINQYIFGSDIKNILFNYEHIEWLYKVQISSFITQLFWVFNQAIPSWLLTMLILNDNDNKRLFVLLVISLLFSTFPTVGLIFIAFYKIYLSDNNKITIKNIINNTKTLISKENILIGIPLFILLATFILSNSTSGLISLNSGINLYIIIFFLLVFEVIIYYIFIFKYTDNKRLAIITFISLIICPFITINNKGDFCMRASIPGLVVTLILLIESLPKIKLNKISYYTLILIFTLGLVTPYNEILRTITNTNKDTIPEYINLITCTYQKNFYGYKDESLFVKYFAKE